MQKRTESNIRDKRLVKMVKLQVKTETKRIAEMLNEMNPKLKALLAAGLIGTAGLGMQSCSNPSDSVYYPYTVEAPSTDNPENPSPSGGEETPVVTATFESLHVQPAYRESLARANKSKSNNIVREFSPITIEVDEGNNIIDSFIYEGNKFISVSYDDENEHDVAEPHIRYKDGITAIYYVPKSMESEFDQARAAFNNAQ